MLRMVQLRWLASLPQSYGRAAVSAGPWPAPFAGTVGPVADGLRSIRGASR